ncbi:hypothetical protein K8Q98_02840 [Candidatus Nomurabacteria bacterium]|nr:hypothetical protein [Candidatus Nomurabacteria bacterium]
MIPEKFIYLTLVASVFGSYFYIRDVIRGTTKPNLVTWFFWALAPIIGTFLQLKAGAGLSVLPVFLAGFMPLVILIIALFCRNSYWKITTFDIFCGVFSFIALILWILTKRADISIFFAILSDALAAVPTLIKSWKFPETETAVGYLPGIFNNILGLLIIKNWNFSIYSFGIYFIVLNSMLIIFILRKKLFSREFI